MRSSLTVCIPCTYTYWRVVSDLIQACTVWPVVHYVSLADSRQLKANNTLVSSTQGLWGTRLSLPYKLHHQECGSTLKQFPLSRLYRNRTM